MKKHILLLILYTCWQLKCFSQIIDSIQNNENQDRKPMMFVDISYHQGPVLAHHEKMKSLVRNNFISVDAKVGFQCVGNNDSNKIWQQKLAYPSYGFGVLYTDFQSSDIGRPFAGYMFFNMPLKRLKRSVFNVEFCTGAAVGFRKYDAETNPNNIAIGSNLNAFVALGTNYEIKISQRLDVKAGVRLAHFSNGTFTQPNLGLNLLDFFIGTKYYFQHYQENDRKKIFERKEFKKYTFERFKPKYEISLFATIANKQIPVPANIGKLNESPNYLAGSLTIDFLRQFNSFQKIGLGMVVFYDQSLEGNPKEDIGQLGYFTQGIHISSELKASKFALMGNVGIYTFRKVFRDFPLYTRLGLRYYVNKNLFISAILKAHLGNADMAEWGIGYRFGKKNK
jgi:hypothetical protein